MAGVLKFALKSLAKKKKESMAYEANVTKSRKLFNLGVIYAYPLYCSFFFCVCLKLLMKNKEVA